MKAPWRFRRGTAREPVDRSGAPSSRRRVALLLVAVAVTSLWLGAVFGKHGLLERLRFEHERDRLRADIQDVQRSNAALAAEVEVLEKNPKAIERIAREELGMGRPGESVIFLPRDAEPASPAQAASAEHAARPKP